MSFVVTVTVKIPQDIRFIMIPITTLKKQQILTREELFSLHKQSNNENGQSKNLSIDRSYAFSFEFHTFNDLMTSHDYILRL